MSKENMKDTAPTKLRNLSDDVLQSAEEAVKATHDKADHEGDDGHDHKDEEQDLGDADGAGSNATKAEDCGDQSDHQKNDCVVQHDHLPKMRRRIASSGRHLGSVPERSFYSSLRTRNRAGCQVPEIRREL